MPAPGHPIGMVSWSGFAGGTAVGGWGHTYLVGRGALAPGRSPPAFARRVPPVFIAPGRPAGACVAGVAPGQDVLAAGSEPSLTCRQVAWALRPTKR